MEPHDPPELALWPLLLRAVDQLSQVGSAFPRVGLIGLAPGLDLVHACLERGGLDPRSATTTPDPDRDEVRRISGEMRRGGAGTAGPPDVVIALNGDLSLAARLVRRGGFLASPVPVSVPAPMAALVQRELTVLPHRNIACTAASSPFLAGIGPGSRRIAIA